jgi:Uma2 family endonuclease
VHRRRSQKAIYERNGVREYWLVDPVARSLSVHGLQGEKLQLGATLSEDDAFESALLPGLSFQVGELFPA